MIFFVDSSGTVFKAVPENVYQGSVNANTIYFVGAFPSNCSVTISYRQPNGILTVPQLMARVTESDLTDILSEKGQGYNVWSAKIDGIATEEYGTVALQFFVYSTDGQGKSVRLATASSSFEVSRGVPIILPDESDAYETLLTDILSALSENQAKYDEIERNERQASISSQMPSIILGVEVSENSRSILLKAPVGLSAIDWGDGTFTFPIIANLINISIPCRRCL